MCDIKTEPVNSVCHGCLSPDRKLSPLTNYELYWSLLKDYQKSQYVAMCWECAAVLRRTQIFRAQVQRAHDILQDMEVSPTNQALSSLTAYVKLGYDAEYQYRTLSENDLADISPIDHMDDIKNIIKDSDIPFTIDYDGNDANENTEDLIMKRRQRINNNEDNVSKYINVIESSNVDKLTTEFGGGFSNEENKDDIGIDYKDTSMDNTRDNLNLSASLEEQINVTSATKNVKDKILQDTDQVDKTEEIAEDSKDISENDVIIEEEFDHGDGDESDDGNAFRDEDSNVPNISKDKKSNCEYKTKRKRNKLTSDPESVLKHVKLNDEPKKKKKRKYYRPKYNKVTIKYRYTAEVLQYFTEIEMDEQEFTSTLEEEDAIVHKKRCHKCKECGQSYMFRRTLITHMKKAHSKRKLRNLEETETQRPRLWRCDICSRMFRRAHLVLHVNEYHRHRYRCAGDGCEWAHRVFMSLEDVHRHWACIHKQFLCEPCGQWFLKKSSITLHMEEKHMTLRQRCGICGRAYTTRSSLLQHVKHKHPPPEPAERRYCVECDVTYSSVPQYKQHVYKRHKHKTEEVKKWPCRVCGRALAGRHTLDNHFAFYHSGTPKFQCHICHKYFSRKGSLSHHLKAHNNTIPKPPKDKICSVCGKAFESNRALRFHMYTHTGERPYKCVHCAAAFTQPHCLTVHLRKTHSDTTTKTLTMQHIAMCWECAALLRRTRAFQAQVQRVHDILQDLTLTPTDHTLSPLSIHFKHDYDVIIGETEKEINSQTNVPEDIKVGRIKKEDGGMNDKNDRMYIEEQKDSSNDSFTSNHLCNNVRIQQTHSDNDNTRNEDECIDNPSDNSDFDNIEADNNNIEADNSIVTPIETTVRRSVRQAEKKTIIEDKCTDSLSDNSDFEADDTNVTSSDTASRRSVREAAKKCRQLILNPKKKKKREKVKRRKARKVANLNETQFVCVPVTPLAIESIQTQVSNRALKSPVNIEKKQETKQVLQSGLKQARVVETPLLIKIEKELKELMTSEKTAPKRVENKTQLPGRDNSKSNDNVEIKSDYELSDVEFNDKELDLKNNSSRNGTSKVTNKSNGVTKHIQESNTEENSDMKHIHTDKNIESNDNDEYNECSNDKNEDQDDLQSENKLNDESKNIRPKRKCTKRYVDPDFIPSDDEKLNLDNNKKKANRTPTRFYRILVKYDNIADVLEYFTETKMSEEEMKKTLEREDAIVNEKKPHKCQKCGECFTYRRGLVYHEKWGHGKASLNKFHDPAAPGSERSLWRCSMCPRTLRRAHLVSHVNQHHRRRYRCRAPGCQWSPRVFTCKEHFDQHWSEIHRRFECDICGRRMRRKAAVPWHMQEKHVKALCLPCPVCGRGFATRTALNKHTANTHAPLEPAELRYCVECDVTYRTVERYRQHLSVKHKARVKEFPCPVCGRVLRSKYSMISHVALQHDGKTKHQCQVCGKYFAWNKALQNHSASHSGARTPIAKNKPCAVCHRMFSTPRALRLHMYTHTGERPYKCVHCAAAFTQPHCLAVHLRKTHSDNTTKVSYKI